MLHYVLNMPITFHFFSHFSFYMPLEVLKAVNRQKLKTVNNDVTSYIKLCFVMLNSNEPIKVARLQKLANQPMLTGALLIEMVNNFFSEMKKNFGHFTKRGTF